MVHNPWFTPSTCKRHHQNLLETLLCVWWFSRLCFWPFLLLDSLQSSTMQALKQTQVLTTQSQLLVTQKRKVLFHTSTDFGGVSNGLRFGGSMVYKGSMMGFWFWFAGSFVWLEWMTVHGKSYFYICEKLCFFLEEHLWKSWCSILLLVGVNHSRIVASLVASISPYCRQGKPPKHLKVKRQAVIINY